MNQDNRVLGRARARELTLEETKHIASALGTETLCTFNSSTGRDGDTFLGEC